MTANQRIALNFVATYGRTLYSLVLGLLCGRWTLKALGEVDYGLMGLIGGLTVFLSFINSLMSTAVGRFFAFSVGKEQKSSGNGIEDCCRWFNAALLIHTAIPVILLVVGYPCGVWAIENFLTIPVDRVDACIWVWRSVCISCFLSMISVPFYAMYQAKQYIAELTVYTFITATLNAFFLYYMVSHPGDWLVKLSFWSCLLGIAPQLIIALRAVKLFPECKIVPSYMWDLKRFKEVFVYAFYRFFGALSMMIKQQGMDIIVNKYLGPARNAAINIGGTVSGHCNNLAGSFLSALSPAITNAYGAGDMERVNKLSFAACKLTAIMVAIFIIPLFSEAHEVFRLWLENPPAGAPEFCLCLLVIMLLENLSCGLYMPIFADGRIKGYQITTLVSGVLTLPIAWILVANGCGITSIGYALISGQIMVVIARVFFAHYICGLSRAKWLFGCFVPVMLVTFVASAIGFMFSRCFAPSFLRIIGTTVVSNVSFLSIVWLFVLNRGEREFCKQRIFDRFFHKGGKK